MRLAEFLYWMACWIAVTVAMMALVALALGGNQAWLSVAAYFVTAAIIWAFGRVVLLIAFVIGRIRRASRLARQGEARRPS